MIKDKKLTVLGLVAAIVLSMAFISCSDSDDDPTSDVITLETPVYDNVSAKYEIRDNSSDISSIELTASGNYIIIYSNTSSYGKRAVAASYSEKNF